MKQKSRDFYWYSPVLKRQLDHVTGDLVVSPKSEAEVIRVLAACYAHRRAGDAARLRHRQLRPGDAALGRRRARSRRDERGQVDRARPRGRPRPAPSSPRSTRQTRAAVRPGAAHVTPRPTTRPRSAASSPAARAASARSAGAACANSATSSACASSPWRPSRASSISTGCGPAEGHARLRHQRHHHRGRDAARRQPTTGST